MSSTAFGWVLTVLTFGGSSWALFDLRNLWKVRNGDRTDPTIRDKQFGYVIGIAVGVIALFGTLHFHGVV